METIREIFTSHATFLLIITLLTSTNIVGLWFYDRKWQAQLKARDESIEKILNQFCSIILNIGRMATGVTALSDSSLKSDIMEQLFHTTHLDGTFRRK
jgi:hypothetical protein